MEQQAVDVFIAHASSSAEQQKEFVDGLSGFLLVVHGLKVVNDSSFSTGESFRQRMLEVWPLPQ